MTLPGDDQVRALQRELADERAARQRAESVAEQLAAELYDTVQQLKRSSLQELLGQVAVHANEAGSTREALSGALASICAHIGWPVGHAFLRSRQDPDLLVSEGIWQAAESWRYDAFRQDTFRSRFRSGVGLPGRALRSGEPVWIGNLDADPDFPRNRSARASGLVSGFAAPVVVAGHTVAVLEFFTTSVQPPDDHVLRVVGFAAAQLGQVFEREAAEERLVQQAMFDSLTGLPNRLLLMDRLSASLARAGRSGGDVHVLYLDVDDFATINETRGHLEGDAVLAALAQRLQGTLRGSDSLGRPSPETVARLGGDEFAIVLEDSTSPEAVVGRIHTALRHPLPIGDHEIFVSVSIGSVVMAGPGKDPQPEEILAAANVAMHEAKRAGKARHIVFQPRMQDAAHHRHVLGMELHQAVERHEFMVAYQPVVDLASGTIVGAEALVRWQHPRRGIVAPDEFIARAEETGLIVGMGTWVLTEACRQASAWRAAGAADFTIAVNVSGRQLKEPDFVSVVRAALREAELDPAGLCLEMTESILMEDEHAGIAMLSELRSDGVHLAIDDFGTGYSSLSALRRLPVNLLKIDQSFVRGLPEDEDAGTIAWAVVRLGHTLGLPVLAEGVETEEQRAALLRFRCDQAQGFLFGQPASAQELGALLAGRP